jgi:hypothetical protein
MKTAVEWLVQEFDLEMQDTFNHKINKAKEMEKERVIDFAENYETKVHEGMFKSAEQYYNETFKSE